MRCHFTIALLVIVAQQLIAQQSNVVSLKISHGSFLTFVNEIERQTTYRFFFDPNEVDSIDISIDVDHDAIENVLQSTLSVAGLQHVIDTERNIIITKNKIIASKWLDKTSPPLSTSTFEQPIDDESTALFKTRKIYSVGHPSARSGTAKPTVTGVVKAVGDVPLVGATISVEGTAIRTITDNEGSYSLSLSPGAYQINFTSVGMKPTQRSIQLYSSGTLNVDMDIEVTRLDEVVVTGERASVSSLQMGTERLSTQTLKYIPSTFGETDVLKAVLTLPGVKTIGEASSGFNIRGGSTDQNLILFNESTVFNPFHFFGFFSSFNAESIRDVELHKSVIPARYGGRLASVLKITSNKGNKKKVTGTAGLGLVTSRINVEGPILKDKTSFNVGARTTYSDWIFDVLPASSGYKNTNASFYDVNVTLDNQINGSNGLTLFGYASRDKSNLNTDTSYTYSNRNFSLQWNHDGRSKINSVVTIGHDHYDYGNQSTSDPLTAYKLKFSIDQSTVKANFFYDPGTKHKMEFGFNGIYYKLHPGSLQPNSDESLLEESTVSPEQAIESAIYVSDQFDLTPKLSFQGGLRYSMFNSLGPSVVYGYADGLPRTVENRVSATAYSDNEIVKTYHGPEWRLSGRYLITPTLSVKAGYSTVRQYIHMLSNTIAIAPTDIWKLSDSNIRPQYGRQYSIGFYMARSKWETSIEAYHKDIDNYLDYRSGAVLVMNPSVETEVLSSKGRGYGIEFIVKKPTGKLNGWLSYTYARILIKTDDPNAGEAINHGSYYPASYDKPHDFNFTGNYKFTRRVSFSMNVNYSTGRPVTIPIGVFSYGGSQKTLYGPRNSYRIPNYFRMDFSFNIEGNHKIRQLLHSSWTFGIYNLTGRNNPYSIYFTSDAGIIKGYKLSIYGSMIPFINYNIRF
jgi:outer membrane cobalamin receptor